MRSRLLPSLEIFFSWLEVKNAGDEISAVAELRERWFESADILHTPHNHTGIIIRVAAELTMYMYGGSTVVLGKIVVSGAPNFQW